MKWHKDIGSYARIVFLTAFLIAGFWQNSMAMACGLAWGLCVPEAIIGMWKSYQESKNALTPDLMVTPKEGE